MHDLKGYIQSSKAKAQNQAASPKKSSTAQKGKAVVSKPKPQPKTRTKSKGKAKGKQTAAPAVSNEASTQADENTAAASAVSPSDEQLPTATSEQAQPVDNSVSQPIEQPVASVNHNCRQPARRIVRRRRAAPAGRRVVRRRRVIRRRRVARPSRRHVKIGGVDLETETKATADGVTIVTKAHLDHKSGRRAIKHIKRRRANNFHRAHHARRAPVKRRIGSRRLRRNNRKPKVHKIRPISH